VPEDFSRSHRSIFYSANGVARTLGDVYGTFNSRINGKADAFRSQVADVAVLTKPVVDDFPPDYFA
jgi:ABC-type sulfate transport system substrate-binding protein